MESTRRNPVVARVAAAIAESGDLQASALEELLTDCAAEALSIRVEILRRSRGLNEPLAGGPPEKAAREKRPALVRANERAWGDWRALGEMIDELRARRRRLPATGPHGGPQLPGAVGTEAR